MNKYKEGAATIHQNIRKILRDRKRGLEAWEITSRYARKFGKLYSDSAITARIREMGDVTCHLTTYKYTLGELT